MVVATGRPRCKGPVHPVNGADEPGLHNASHGMTAVTAVVKRDDRYSGRDTNIIAFPIWSGPIGSLDSSVDCAGEKLTVSQGWHIDSVSDRPAMAAACKRESFWWEIRHVELLYSV